jgi:hypothetical protein
VLPPNTAATFPWMEATSAGSDPIYGGYYMSSGKPHTAGCGLLATSVRNALLLPKLCADSFGQRAYMAHRQLLAWHCQAAEQIIIFK